MKQFRVLTAFLLAAVLPIGAALADTYFQSVNETDAFQMGGQQQPARVDTMEVWLSGDKAAMTYLGGQKMIIDGTKGMMYFVQPAEKAYYEIPADLVASIADSLAPSDLAAADSVREMLKQMMGEISYTIEPTDSTEKVGDWNTRIYRISMSMPMGINMTGDVWVTSDVKIDWEMYRALTMQTLAIMPGAEKIFDEMKKMEGMTVKSVTSTNMMGTEVKSVQRLLNYNPQAEAPAGLYDIPADYTKSDSPLMLMGQ